MLKPILLDTDVLIDFLRGHDQAISFVNAHSERIMVSSVTVAELYAGVRGGREDTEQTVLDDLLGLFKVVPVTEDIGRVGGLYKRDYGASHAIGLADAIIAATATLEDAAIETLNVRHYPMFAGLEPTYRK